MAEYRRTNETREPHSWFADDDARRRRGNGERDAHYPYGSDRYTRYESSRSSYPEHRDVWQPHERGGYWRQYEHSSPLNFAGRGPRDYQRSDTRIREEICDRMTDDPMLDASQISVEVRDGEVILTGSVTSRDQKRRAEDVADRVSGAKDVTNQLRVMRDGMGHDGSIGASGNYGRETTSSQPAHEVSRATASKSTSSSTT